MVQITRPVREEKKGTNFMGTIGSIGGGIVGGFFGKSPQAVAAGSAIGSQIGGQIGSAFDKPSEAPKQAGGVAMDAMGRRAQAQDGDSYGQLKQGLMASANLPPEQRAQHAPQIMQAMQQMAVG